MGHFLFLFMARYLRRGLTGIFLYPVCLFYFFLIPRSRSGSDQFFKHLYPKSSKPRRLVLAFKRVLTFSHILLDRGYLSIRGAEIFKVTFLDTHHVLKALELNRGVIILSAHLGNWDIISRHFKRFKRPVSVVAYHGERPEIQNMYRHMEKKSTLPFTYINSDDPLEVIIAIKSALAQNEIIIMHGDRDLNNGIRGTFFKGDVLFPNLPYVVASKTNTPIVCAFGVRTGSLSYQAFAFPHFLVGNEGEKDIAQALQNYIHILEHMVKKYPLQWNNYYRFWGDSSE